MITSWTSNGMDWDNINPINKDYYRAIRFAMLDRGIVDYLPLDDTIDGSYYDYTNMLKFTDASIRARSYLPNTWILPFNSSNYPILSGLSITDNIDYLEDFDTTLGAIPFPYEYYTSVPSIRPLLKGATLDALSRLIPADDCIRYDDVLYRTSNNVSNNQYFRRLTSAEVHKKVLRFQYLVLNQVKASWKGSTVGNVDGNVRYRTANGSTYSACLTNLASTSWSTTTGNTNSKSLNYNPSGPLYTASETELTSLKWKLPSSYTPLNTLRFPMTLFVIMQPTETQTNTSVSFLKSGHTSQHIYETINATVNELEEEIDILTTNPLVDFPVSFGGGGSSASVSCEYRMSRYMLVAFTNFMFKE